MRGSAAGTTDFVAVSLCALGTDHRGKSSRVTRLRSVARRWRRLSATPREMGYY